MDTATRNGVVKVVTRVKGKYTLEELPALIQKLEREPISPEEIARRRKLSAEVDRIRNAMPEIPEPIEDWIRKE